MENKISRGGAENAEKRGWLQWNDYEDEDDDEDGELVWGDRGCFTRKPVRT